jgi:hypothetical protein
MNLKFLKKKKKFKKGGLGIKPDLYWQYILFVTFILIFLASIFGLYIFWEVNNKSTLPVSNIGEQEAIKKERIDKILEYFQEREKKSLEIINSPSPIVDPSL